MDQRTIDLYEKYSHGAMDRREFLKRLAVMVGGVAAANAMLPLLEGKSAMAQIVPKDDSPPECGVCEIHR